MTVFTPGDYFGECNIVWRQVQKTNIICLDLCEFWCLDKESLDDILRLFPHIKRTMAKMSYDSNPDTTFLPLQPHPPALVRGRNKPEKIVLGTVSGGLLRSLSMNQSEEGHMLPSSRIADAVDDPVQGLGFRV